MIESVRASVCGINSLFDICRQSVACEAVVDETGHCRGKPSEQSSTALNTCDN